MNYKDYHNHLVRLSEKTDFPTTNPSICFSDGDAFNAEVRELELSEGLNHEEACSIVSNRWMGRNFIDPDDLEDDIDEDIEDI